MGKYKETAVVDSNYCINYYDFVLFWKVDARLEEYRQIAKLLQKDR